MNGRPTLREKPRGSIRSPKMNGLPDSKSRKRWRLATSRLTSSERLQLSCDGSLGRESIYSYTQATRKSKESRTTFSPLWATGRVGLFPAFLNDQTARSPEF